MCVESFHAEPPLTNHTHAHKKLQTAYLFQQTAKQLLVLCAFEGSVSCSKKRCVLAGSHGCWGGRMCSPSWKLISLEYALGMYWCTISQENRAWKQDFWLAVLGRKELSSIVFSSSLKRQIDGLGLLGIAADSLKYHVSALLCWCELLNARHYVPKDSQWLSSSDTW